MLLHQNALLPNTSLRGRMKGDAASQLFLLDSVDLLRVLCMAFELLGAAHKAGWCL